MSPNPKRTIGDEGASRIQAAWVRHENSYAEYQAAVREALSNGTGVRAVAELAGLPTSTEQRWKNDAL